MKMRALKSFSYNTRRLLPGDHFETKRDIDARLLEVNRRAERVREIGTLPPPPADLAKKLMTNPLDHDGNGEPGGSKIPDGDKEALNKLRAEYTELLGKKPFPGWDAAELQKRIDEALAS